MEAPHHDIYVIGLSTMIAVLKKSKRGKKRISNIIVFNFNNYNSTTLWTFFICISNYLSGCNLSNFHIWTLFCFYRILTFF